MKPADSPSETPLSEGTKGLLSLLLILHLTCVLTVLAANFRRSSLLNELTRIFAPYTQSLHLDPERTAFHLTHGDVLDDDAVLTVELYRHADAPLADQQPLATVTLPDRGSRWLDGRRRYLALARTVQINSPVEGEPTDYEGDVTIALAKSAGRSLMEEHEARRAVVRCLRRLSQPRDPAELDPGFPPEDPQDAAYDVTVLTADVWIDDDGRTQGARRVPRREQAPLRTEAIR
jgi:hypothetical protein